MRATSTGNSRGYSLLELVSVLAIASIVALTLSTALRSLDRAARLESARVSVALAALASRRRAYSDNRSVRLETRSGATVLTAHTQTGPPMTFPLPNGTHLASGPAHGAVSFRPTGYADNATIHVAVAGSDRRASVVINQRGLVR